MISEVVVVLGEGMAVGLAAGVLAHQGFADCHGPSAGGLCEI